MPSTSPPRPDAAGPHGRLRGARRRLSPPAWGLLAAVVLLVLAMAVPALTGWNVRVRWFPPIHAEWQPRLGAGTVPALLVAGLAGWQAAQRARTLSWPALLLVTWLTGVVWMLSLAFIDGASGVGRILDDDYEYLHTARTFAHDVPTLLGQYVERIPYAAEPDNWPVHIAGHPPGAVLFFIGLVRLGLGTGFEAGTAVVLVAATTPLAVLTVARLLGAEQRARTALPFLVLGPAAIWQAVSADAVFAAVAAWGTAALAAGATRRSALWSLVAGVLLGSCVMMSYGLPLLGLLAVAVLLVARSWFPLPWAVASALAVVLAFVPFGFAWWEALPVLQERYFEGVGGRRPAAYWLWGNLAALTFATGPLLGAALVAAWRPMVAAVRRPSRDVLATLTLAGVAMVVAANLSQMSRAEVERIWLPFVPWLMLSVAFLPERWRRRGLWLQVAFALVVAHLLWTDW
jgi:hypothetical protein